MKNTNRRSLFAMPASSSATGPASSFVAAPASFAAATASAAPPNLRHTEQVNNKASQFQKKGCDHYKLRGIMVWAALIPLLSVWLSLVRYKAFQKTPI